MEPGLASGWPGPAQQTKQIKLERKQIYNKIYIYNKETQRKQIT